MSSNQHPWPQQPRPQQIQVTIEKADQVICQECGGFAILMQGAFLPKKQVLVGQKPSLVAAPLVLCSQCGKEITEPFVRLGDVKEAS